MDPMAFWIMQALGPVNTAIHNLQRPKKEPQLRSVLCPDHDPGGCDSQSDSGVFAFASLLKRRARSAFLFGGVWSCGSSGDYIDARLGVTLGLSTMAAAAWGNTFRRLGCGCGAK